MLLHNLVWCCDEAVRCVQDFHILLWYNNERCIGLVLKHNPMAVMDIESIVFGGL